MEYSVLIMDVVGSKKYESKRRQELQELLAMSLEYLNGLFSDRIEKSVTFSAGDEVQGMFSSCAAAFLYFRYLSLIVGKGIFRGGIGRGTWDVKVKKESSTFQDGEAYHRAREAIEWAHRDRGYALQFVLGTGLEEELTVLADHSLGIIEMRTESQNDLAFYQETLNPLVFERKSDGIRNVLAPLLNARLFWRVLAKDSSKTKVSDKEWETSGRAIELLPDMARMRSGWYDLGNLGAASSFHMIPESAYEFEDELSWLLQKTRQSVEVQLRKARVLQERNAAANFVCYCERREL